MPEIRKVDIDLIQTDVDQIQTRLGLDEKRVEVLCEKYQELGADAFPLPIVFLDEAGEYWLSDGHYRLAAIRKALGPKDPPVVQVEVREGSMREAAFFAAGANRDHGTQLTWEEMRRNVIRLLRDSKWGEMSDRDIARHVGASNNFVSKIHRELDDQDASVSGSQIPQTRKVKTQRGGKPLELTINRSRRGRRKKAETNTIPTPPASQEVSQEEPITDEGYERTTDDDQESVIPTDLHTLPDECTSESDDDRWPDPPNGFVELIAAWFRATADGRQTFLAWAQPRNINERAGQTTPEQHAHYYLLGAEVLQDMAEALHTMR